jgi:membrane protein YqaA with SNARE-associated domain
LALPFAFCLLPFAFTPLLALFGRLADMGNSLMAYGAIGLFGISFLDSAFVPLPSGPDLVMIALSAANHAMMPVYALAATFGSTIGCTILYLIARRAGMAALSRVRPERRDKIENLLGRYDMLAVMIPAILPPPFPFKPFVLAAGAFKFKIPRFVTAIFLGRAIRFLLEGWLAIQFGRDAFNLIKQNGLKVLLIVLALLAVFFAMNLYRRKRGKQLIDIEESLPPL